MSDALIAISTELSEDLRVFSAFLWQQGLSHQISELSGIQVLTVESESLLPIVQGYYSEWKSGNLQLEIVENSALKSHAAPHSPSFRDSLAGIPMTLLAIITSFCGFMLFMVDSQLSLVSYLTYLDFKLVGDRLLFNTAERDLWRYITPIFLHFGWLHIVFNSLWLWEIGGRIERSLGPIMLLGLIIVSGVISNAAQYWLTGPGLFGGMSGVVYALLGFSWLAGWLRPEWKISLPVSIVILMVGWLLVCMSGLIEILGLGAIANGAHLGGLLVGCCMGLLFGLFGKKSVA